MKLFLIRAVMDSRSHFLFFYFSSSYHSVISPLKEWGKSTDAQLIAMLKPTIGEKA